MHSVGYVADGEYVAGDGTLHTRSIVRRMVKKRQPTQKLDEMFIPPGAERPLEVEGVVEKEEEEEEEEEEVIEHIDVVAGGSIAAAVFGIIKGMVGPAILYLPRGFELAGFAVAIPAMFVATASYVYCATRLLQCWKIETDKAAESLEKIRLLLDPESTPVLGKKNNSYGSLIQDQDDTAKEQKKPQMQGKLLTYPELARRAFGNFSVLISGGIAAMQFGVCLTYLIFVPQNLFELIRNVFGVFVRKEIILIGMLAIEIPLCWIRDIRKLTPFNISATFLIAFGLASVLFIAVFNANDDNTVAGTEGEEGMNLFKEIANLPLVENTWYLFIGTSFFCFEGSITLLVPLQEAVYSQKDREQFPTVNKKVMWFTVAFYMIFATICWSSFGDSVQTALTASLPKGTLSTLVQFAYSVAVIFTFPLQAFPALEVVCHTNGAKTGSNKRKSERSNVLKRNMTATVIICFLGLIAVIATNYLGNVVSLLGSLVGIPIALIYPPLMHNKLVPNSSKMTRIMNVCLSVVGVFAAGAASYTTIISWNEGAEG